jgi:hypothetical protein
MKQFIAKYMLYIYLNFLKDDDIYKEWATTLIKIIYFYRSIYVWTASVIFFPIFYIGMIFEDKYRDEFDEQMKKMIEIYQK